MGKKYKRTDQIKTEKPDIRKMMKYTIKKILWVTNYSLSFSRKDEKKEILIKLLGCVVILQSVSLILSFVLKVTRIVSINPFFSSGLLMLAGVILFKKELSSFLKSSKSKSKEEETVF
ncbi:MAG: hypothetical protein OXB86_02635 [Bdellovibrionales bacterium]|nr:hypothetical protein [Bdellovibrionales bacterium]